MRALWHDVLMLTVGGSLCSRPISAPGTETEYICLFSKHSQFGQCKIIKCRLIINLHGSIIYEFEGILPGECNERMHNIVKGSLLVENDVGNRQVEIQI